MVEVQGRCDERFSAVADAFARNFADHGDVGACAAVSLEGEMIVDLWGGYRDRDRRLPWQEDTIVNVYSTTKTMTALCALVLADRGQLDFYAPVAHYWPEFAQHGKEQIQVRHLMSHSAGLSGMDEACAGDVINDWDYVVAALARQAPWWEPGTASGYHAITQGHLIGEVVRRITGRSLGTFFAEDIAGPLQADFHIGTDEPHFARIAELIPPTQNHAAESLDADSRSISAKTFRNPAVVASDAATPGWRKAEIPAANGHGNARSVVRAQTPIANGGQAFGVELLSPAGVSVIFDEQTYGKDLVLGETLRFGMGYGLTSSHMPMGPNERIAYWGGWGGSTIVVDQDAHLCVSYVMNKMSPGALGDPRGFGILQAAYASL